MNLAGKVELLSPAKNAEVGIVAINHGADAVYIGAPQFSARAAVGNGLADIERLVEYAHRYYARVYVALNTILTDDELVEADMLIRQLYNIGVDALIVQDMGILELSLPPISLHASTQCDNRTLEKVQFLERCGFEQVVLARELSLNQIKTVSDATNVALECFVHGALCVSYSGQCYASEALKGRSANRGVCAQICRLPFDLRDADESLLVSQKHFLSLKDLDASNHLNALLDAGVSSLKIEGRLKDADYVKNITAFYRRKLDALLENSTLSKASSGKVHLFFEPNPQKTFHRGCHDYFLEARRSNIVALDTPKSSGEFVGNVKNITQNSFVVANGEKLHNGDGLCCLDSESNFVGFRVNKVVGDKVFPLCMPHLAVDTQIYRNFDIEFSTMLESDKTAVRKLGVTVTVSDTAAGLRFTVIDEDSVMVQMDVICDKVLAKNPEKALETFRTQFSKLGNTLFELRDFQWAAGSVWFVPISHLTEWRRDLLASLEIERTIHFQRRKSTWQITNHSFPKKTLTYTANIMNKKALEFYKRHGVTTIAPAFEAVAVDNVPIMRTKYCLKHAMGWCSLHQDGTLHKEIKKTLFLQTSSAKLRLEFDCKHCEMLVYQVKA